MGADPYVDREGRLGNVTYIVFTAVVFFLLAGVPIIIMIAAGKDMGDILLGTSFFIVVIVGLFGWGMYDDNRNSPDRVRLAIDAAGIYVQGGRQPRWDAGRIPWAQVAEVVLSTRRGSMPPLPYVHVEIRLKYPGKNRHGKPQTQGPSVVQAIRDAGTIQEAIKRHAPRIRVTRR